MDTEHHIANDPYSTLRDQLAPTVHHARRMVLASAGGIAGVLVWMSLDLANPFRRMVAAAFVLLLSTYIVFNGIGAARRRMQHHVLDVLHQAHYDEQTLAALERHARSGGKIPWISHDAAMLAAIATYRQEAQE